MASAPLAPLLDFEARILCLTGVIGDVEVNILVDLLLRCDEESSEEITLYISAQGGDMIQSLKVLDTLRLLRSPVMSVGFGFIEGTAVVVLAACPKRVIFHSVIISTAGLWSLPTAHDDLRQPMGLRGSVDPRHHLLAKVRERVEQAFAATPKKIPSLIADPAEPPRLFDAEEAIEAGICDGIVTGSQRRLLQPSSRKYTNAKPKSFTV